MREQVQSQKPQLCKVEAAHDAAETVQAAAGFSSQSFAASGSALQGQVGQLVYRVEEIGVDAAGTRQKRYCKVGDVLFKHDGLRLRLYPTPLLLFSESSHSLTAAPERLK